ncbi:MAG: tRNA (N(6)-L-threonylcarbamoyladenosine(37)-C(2))-methylthiotransferase MtaB [Bacteroidales bacterium]|nr:tRNA (N(6)-L-threonylcarbamoyladenosine(37)-C(2))-methylthiotransferase MtaB [Bacteroidales bacterium]
MKKEQKTVVIQTLGCKLNFAESAAMLQLLEQKGYRQVKMGEEADLCIINTCSVTETADQKDRQTIHKLVRMYPQAFVAVCGCYAQLKPQEIANIPGVDLVLGADFKMELADLIEDKKRENCLVKASANDEIKRFLPACSKGNRTRFFLKVQDGCDYFCAYCTVPYARGRSRNPDIASLVAQAKEVAENGGKEIVLTGINIGTFGKSTGENFLQLIQALDQVEGIERYRISSMEPDLLSDEMIAFVAQSKRFAPHFHLPLQAGNNEMLDLMGRHYHRELFAEKIYAIKKAMPDAFIGVDVIVGMRGEKAELFEDGRQFLESLPISQLHVFSYSERPGTRALEIDYKVAEKDKKQRSRILHELSEQKRLEFYRSQSGKKRSILFEHGKKNGKMYGFSDNYIRVEAPYRKDWENSTQTLCLGDFNEDKSALIAQLS